MQHWCYVEISTYNCLHQLKQTFDTWCLIRVQFLDNFASIFGISKHWLNHAALLSKLYEGTFQPNGHIMLVTVHHEQQQSGLFWYFTNTAAYNKGRYKRVTRLGEFLHFGQLFKAFGNNYFTQISHILRHFFAKVSKYIIFQVKSFLGNF